MTSFAASGSSRGRSWGATSKIVTAQPKRWRDWAISMPMGPAPMRHARGGSASRLKKLPFVRWGVSRRPGTGTTAAEAPVAIMHLSKVTVCVAPACDVMTTSVGLANFAAPMQTSSQKSRP